MFSLSIFLVAVSHVLEKYEEEFFKVVDAKYNLLRLKRKMVIDGGLMAKIESNNNETAKELLFDHLKSNANVVTLREYCKIVIVACRGFPKDAETWEANVKGVAARRFVSSMHLCTCGLMPPPPPPIQSVCMVQ